MTLFGIGWPPISSPPGLGGSGGGGGKSDPVIKKDDPSRMPMPDSITSALKCGCGHGNAVCPIKYKILEDAFNSGDPVKLAAALRTLVKMQPDLLTNTDFFKAVLEFAGEKNIDKTLLTTELRSFVTLIDVIANPTPQSATVPTESKSTPHHSAPLKDPVQQKSNPQPKSDLPRQSLLTGPKDLPKTIQIIKDLPSPVVPKPGKVSQPALPQATVQPRTTPMPTAPQLTAVTIAVQTAIVSVPNRPLMTPLLSQLAQLPPAVTKAVTQLAQPQTPVLGVVTPVAHPPAVVAVMLVAAKAPDALPVVATALATVQTQVPAQLPVITQLVQSLNDQAPKQILPLMTAIQTIAIKSPQTLSMLTPLLAPMTKPDSPLLTPKAVAAMVTATQTVATVVSQPQLAPVLPTVVALVQQAPAVVGKLARLIQAVVTETPAAAPQVLQSVLTGVSRGSVPRAAVVALATIAQAQPAIAAAALPVLNTVATVAPKLAGPVVKLIVEVATQSPSQLPTVMAVLQDAVTPFQPAPNLNQSPQPPAQPMARPQVAPSVPPVTPDVVRSDVIVGVKQPTTVQFQSPQTLAIGQPTSEFQPPIVAEKPAAPANSPQPTPIIQQKASPTPSVEANIVVKPVSVIASVITTLQATVLPAPPAPVTQPSMASTREIQTSPTGLSRPVETPVLARATRPSVPVQSGSAAAPKIPLQQPDSLTQLQPQPQLQPENLVLTAVSGSDSVEQPITEAPSKPATTPMTAEKSNLPHAESKPTAPFVQSTNTGFQPELRTHVSLASSSGSLVSDASGGNPVMTASSSPAVASNASGSSAAVSVASANTGSTSPAPSVTSVPTGNTGPVMGQLGGVAARGGPFVPVQPVISYARFQQPMQPSPIGRPTSQPGAVQMAQGQIAAGSSQKIAVTLKAFIQQFPELASVTRSVGTAVLTRFPQLAQALSATLQSLMQLPSSAVKALLASLQQLLSNPQITSDQVRMVLTVIQAVSNHLPEMMPRFTAVLDKLAQLGPQSPLFNELMATMDLIAKSNRTDAAIRLLQVLKLAEKALGETPELKQKIIQELRRIRKLDGTQAEDNRERFASTEALIHLFDRLEMENWKMAALFRRQLAKTGTDA